MDDIPTRFLEALAGRYIVEKEIGAGGMATVFLARDVKHRRKVAIKVLRPDLAETLGSERFLREIEVAAALSHPHILPLYDSGEAGGFLYYVSPFIKGESLRDRLAKEGSLPVPDAARIFREIVEALGEAHRNGIVHRDVKPANVLLSGGHALVADFGVARAVRESADERRLTTTGVAIGTPQYMAPEQAAADPATDHRADLFAAGVIAYEMLVGTSPFSALSTAAVFAALMTKSPEPPHGIRHAVPDSLGELVMACLEKDPANRPGSADEVLGRLDSILTPTAGVGRSAGGSVGARSGRLITPLRVAAVAVVLAAGSLAGWRIREQRALERWARAEAIPEVLRLAGEGRRQEAAELAEQAERIVGPDRVLETVWPRISTPFRVVTDPPGAELSYRPYQTPAAEWNSLGTTPYSTERFPVGAYRFRVVLDGYEPLEEARSFIPADQMASLRAAGFDYLTDPSYVIDVRLAPAGSLPDGMVEVTGGMYGLLPISGFGTLAPLNIPRFFLDRTEVTNAAYQEFVEAGGHTDSTSWVEPFQREGRAIGWNAAMQEFRDATGRPGPATWVLGRAPPEQEKYPVGGVSWYEASAYCRWRGKALPTLFHWARAAMPSSDVWLPFNPLLAAASNLAADGPLPVASRDAIGVSGAHDLAGNVREWVSTAANTGRYLAGGAWSDIPYALHDQTVASPWVRLPTDGFRCASYPEGEPDEALRTSLDYPVQDFTRDVTVSDDVFEAMRRPYAYDHDQRLLANVDSSRALDWATVEWVSVDTPYGDRLPIRLHLPVAAAPPYQAVVFFAGGNVLRSHEIGPAMLDFIVRSGRALVEPVYEGTFQRNDGRTLQRWTTPSSQAEMLTHWVQELGRVIDYLEERPDFDGSRVAYLGLSFGAGITPALLPYETRFRAAVLYSGGFGKRENQASIDQRSARARRIRVPLLMLGGRHDFANAATHQEALLRAFGTPPENKRLRIYEDAGHWPLPMNEVIRETVDWLDQYMGPVTSRP